MSDEAGGIRAAKSMVVVGAIVGALVGFGIADRA